MKLLGIDFGSKRVGIAVADTEAGLAFPKGVIPNDKFLLGEIKNLCTGYGTELIVIGESKDLDGKENKIMKDIKLFKKMLEQDLQIDVVFEPEFMSSQQALHLQEDTKLLDASAAAVILQSYIDKLKNKNGK